MCRSRRGLYNKCVCDGDLQRDRMGYTDWEQKTPAAVFFVGLAVVAIAGLLGLQGNSNVTLGMELMFTSERARPNASNVNFWYFSFLPWCKQSQEIASGFDVKISIDAT